MGERVWQAMLAGMMILAALFMLSLFDIALYGGQCSEYCGGCYSDMNIFRFFGCQGNLTDGCLKGCERRGVSCDFDPIYNQSCEKCRSGCGRDFQQGSEGFENCTAACFS